MNNFIDLPPFIGLFDEDFATILDVDALMSWMGKLATLQVVEGTIFFVGMDGLNGGCAVLINEYSCVARGSTTA